MQYIKWPDRVWEQDDRGQWASRPVSKADIDRRKAVEKELKGNSQQGR